MISAAKEDIIKAYYPGYFIQSVDGQIQTRQELSKYDDSYQGERGWHKKKKHMMNIHMDAYLPSSGGHAN